MFMLRKILRKTIKYKWRLIYSAPVGQSNFLTNIVYNLRQLQSACRIGASLNRGIQNFS